MQQTEKKASRPFDVIVLTQLYFFWDRAKVNGSFVKSFLQSKMCATHVPTNYEVEMTDI